MVSDVSYHGKHGYLDIEYPKTVNYKDTTQSTNIHFAYTANDASLDADPETAFQNATEYTNAYYQTVGVNDTNTVDSTITTNAYHAIHYFKVSNPTSQALLTKIKISVHAAADAASTLTDGWKLYAWDGYNNSWHEMTSTTKNTEVVLECTLDSTTTPTCTYAVEYQNDLIFAGWATGAADGSNASNLNVAYVEVKFWYPHSLSVVKNWSAKVSKKVIPLYTQDQTTFEDIIQTHQVVDCKFSLGKFYPELTAEIYGTIDTDQDVDGETDDGQTRATIKDTSIPSPITFYGSLIDGSDAVYLRVDGVVLDGAEIYAPETDWFIQNFSGTGRTAHIEYAT